MNYRDFHKNVFPLGSHLCREPMPPMTELKADMAILKNNGFNLIKLQEHWMIDEPVEGECDFSRYEELIEHAAGLDMGVYVGLTCEQAPHWLYEKHPACRMVGMDGQPIIYEAQTTLPVDGKPGPCCDHTAATQDQLRFIKELVSTLGAHENVVIWNTWQEIGHWAEGTVGQKVCYCGNTLRAYRKWLQSVFGDLDQLNVAWNSRYPDWAAVVPDRTAKRVCQPQYFYWNYFMDNVQTSTILRMRAEAVREADPLNRPVFAHLGAPSIGSGRDWAYAKCQDFLGSSCYPCWTTFSSFDDGATPPYDKHVSLLTEAWGSVAIRFDYMRGINDLGAPNWAAEFQGGPVITGLQKGRVPSPDDMRRWVLTALGSGMTALSLWVTRAEIMASEVNGFSLLDSAGDTTPRFEEAGRIGRAINLHADIFAHATRPQADVAIVINEWSYQLCSALATGGEHLNYSVRGWHRLMWDMGIPVDFIEASQLSDTHIADYKALVLAFPLSMSEETAGRLTQYVENGGHVVSEACPGRINENAFCNRGELSPKMAALFGVKHKSLTMVREPDGESRWSQPEKTWGEYLDPVVLKGTGILSEHTLRANVYVETYDETDAVACLRYAEQTAGTRRHIGTGSAWLLGTFVGHCGTAYRNEENHETVKLILEACGVDPSHAGNLLLQKRIASNKEAWLFTNPTTSLVTESINVHGWTDVHDLLDEPLARTDDNIELTVDSLDVRVLILSN